MRLETAARAPDGSYFAAGGLYGHLRYAGRELVARHGWDSVVLHLSQTGEWLDAKTFGGSGASRVTDIAVGSDGAVHLSGAFERSFSLGGLKLTTRSDGVDSYVGALKADGKPSFLVAPDFQIRSMWLSASGETCFSGSIHGPAPFQRSASGNALDSDGPWTGPIPPDAVDILRPAVENVFRCYDGAGRETRSTTFGNWRVTGVSPMVRGRSVLAYTRRDPKTLESVSMIAPFDEDFSMGAQTELLRKPLTARVHTPLDPRTHKPVGRGVVVLDADDRHFDFDIARSEHGIYVNLDAAPDAPDRLVHVTPEGRIAESVLLFDAPRRASVDHVLVDAAGLPVVLFGFGNDLLKSEVSSNANVRQAFVIARLTADLRLVSAEIVFDPYDDTSEFLVSGKDLVRVSGPTFAVLPNF